MPDKLNQVLRLKALGGAELCERAGVSPDARAEVIDLPGFLGLAKATLNAPGG